MLNLEKRILAVHLDVKSIGYASFCGADLIDFAVKPMRRGRSSLELLTNIERFTSRLLAEKRPDTLVMERDWFSLGRHNALQTVAIYKMKAIARRASVAVREITPNTVRKVICGDGHASKRDVARLLVGMYPELGVYIAPSRRWKQRQFMNVFDAIGCGLAYRRKESSGHESK